MDKSTASEQDVNFAIRLLEKHIQMLERTIEFLQTVECNKKENSNGREKHRDNVDGD